MSTITEPTPLATVHGLYHIAILRQRGNSIPTSLDYASSTGRPRGLAILHVYTGGPALGSEGPGRDSCDGSRLAVVLGLSL